MLQVRHFTGFFLKFKRILLVKRAFFLLSAAFTMANLDVTCTLFIICYHAAQILETFHILRLLLIYHNF